MEQEVESVPFTVHFTDGEELYFPCSDTESYQWALTPGGDVLIYHNVYHAQFSVAVVKDRRIAAYAKGTWSRVEIDSNATDEMDAEEEAQSAVIH